MTDLSPATQAVWTAYETADCDPYLVDPRKAGIAAALRAAADTLLDHDYWNGYVTGWDNKPAIFYRKKLLAIADELETND